MDKFTFVGFTKLDHKRNSDVRERLKVTVVDEEQQRYQQNKKEKKRNVRREWKETSFR